METDKLTIIRQQRIINHKKIIFNYRLKRDILLTQINNMEMELGKLNKEFNELNNYHNHWFSLKYREQLDDLDDSLFTNNGYDSVYWELLGEFE